MVSQGSVFICGKIYKGTQSSSGNAYLLLLLVDMTNLEPNVGFCERARRRVQDVSETLK